MNAGTTYRSPVEYLERDYDVIFRPERHPLEKENGRIIRYYDWNQRSLLGYRKCGAIAERRFCDVLWDDDECEIADGVCNCFPTVGQIYSLGPPPEAAIREWLECGTSGHAEAELGEGVYIGPYHWINGRANEVWYARNRLKVPDYLREPIAEWYRRTNTTQQGTGKNDAGLQSGPDLDSAGRRAA